ALVALIGDDGFSAEWRQISAEIDRLRTLRNDAVHSVWHVVGPEHWQHRVKAKGRVTIKYEATPTADLTRLAKELDATSARVTSFSMRVNAAGAYSTLNQAYPPGWALDRGQPRQAQPRTQARARKPSARQRRDAARGGK